MKRNLIFGGMILAALASFGQDVKLLAPQTDKGLPAMQAFAERRSTREYADRDLSQQDLSNLLWATMGRNRADKLTAPSCQNKQEIRLFVFTATGAYEYMPADHSLRLVAEGDHRSKVAGRQAFVNNAPVSLVMVADMEKFGSSDERAMMMAAVDAGIVSENACLAAAGLGLATVPRASMEVAEIQKLLGLSDLQIPVMNNPVGYFK